MSKGRLREIAVGFQRFGCAGEVGSRDQQIDVFRESRLSVECHGGAADQDIGNFAIAEGGAMVSNSAKTSIGFS